MTNPQSTLRDALTNGLIWAGLWMGLWLMIAIIIGILDPDNIDPGEGLMMIVVLGPMGLLSGLLFGSFLPIGRDQGTKLPSLARVMGCGMISSAIVQVVYIGHGDAGLIANTKMALLFCAIGCIVTLAWFRVSKTWGGNHGIGRIFS